MRTAIFVAALAGLGAIASPALAQDAAHHAMMMPHDGTLLTIAAEGRTSRVPDLATIRAGVTSEAASAGEAMRQTSSRMAQVIAALRRAGIAERDIQTANIALGPRYRYADNEPPTIVGYQATNTVSVRFRDIEKSGAILDALVGQGATNIDGPSLSIDQPDAALDEARRDAIARARARAELYAGAAGLRVDRIVSISEGHEASPPVPVMMTARMESDSGRTQVLPGEQDVTVSVTVRFLLK